MFTRSPRATTIPERNMPWRYRDGDDGDGWVSLDEVGSLTTRASIGMQSRGVNDWSTTLEVELERDTPGDNVFEVSIDGPNAANVTPDSQDADGTISDVAVYAQPVSLGRGAHVVRIAWGPDTHTGPSDAGSDDCDGNGTIHGWRLRRVGP
jgi:hypothetical protein